MNDYPRHLAHKATRKGGNVSGANGKDQAPVAMGIDLVAAFEDPAQVEEILRRGGLALASCSHQVTPAQLTEAIGILMLALAKGWRDRIADQQKQDKRVQGVQLVGNLQGVKA